MKRLFAIALSLLAACAQYEVKTNRAVDYSGHIERLAVWSALGSVPLLGTKHWTQSDSFANAFNAAMKATLEGEKLRADVHPFSPKADDPAILGRFEKDLAPNARLLIQPTRYREMRANNGTPTVSALWLDLSLFDVASNRRIWRGELQVDIGMDPTVWNQPGAEKLAAHIVEALKKDRLL